ncbi:MAG: pyridoxamine 5'-phosphate oxidase family protein [Candidatus Fermentibacter sp.]|nr:pyridoxamine 5'-phosphate oxidase family protein [Candidatus Fermentibacter sp.]
MKRVFEFLRSSRVFYLATVDGDQPRVRPLGFHMEFEGRLYLGVGTHKNVYRQVRENPKIELCAVGGMGEWMRITATAVIDQRQEVVDYSLESMPSLREIYNEKTGYTIGTFFLKNAEAVFYDMKGGCEKVSF